MAVVTALISAPGSGAAAADLVPNLILPTETTLAGPSAEPARRFVANPMVQPIPDDSAPNSSVFGQGEESSETASLAQLVTQKSPPAYLSSEMRCLASAIYFEARGESLDGQLAVGNVVINRVQSGRFPASYCGVVYQPEQFSFVHGRSMPSVREGSSAWREAVAIAQIADDGSWKSPAPGALFFHATRVSPNWRLTRLARVDNHVFYR
ncbi:cell wall hydrolase [Novosphingobium sp. Rr 2-17]|uniref:cell wall hydrolase n=1 Tax=Novosphingobium sp. Rr 2-17 TaxID=555793 RepID=UPI00031BC5B1